MLVLTSLFVAARQASMVAKLPTLWHNIVTTMNTIKHGLPQLINKLYYTLGQLKSQVSGSSWPFAAGQLNHELCADTS